MKFSSLEKQSRREMLITLISCRRGLHSTAWLDMYKQKTFSGCLRGVYNVHVIPVAKANLTTCKGVHTKMLKNL